MHFDQQKRYSRQINLPEIGLDGQKKLAISSVLVVGAGGLGAPLLLYLAAAGIGRIGIIDADKVEISNLQRQILFETGDVGRSKVESARDALLDLNPEIIIEIYNQRLDADNCAELIVRYDIIADACDNFPTRFLLNKACFAAQKTLVSAAVIGFRGQLSTFKAHLGGEHPCYQCWCPEEPPAEGQNCAASGVLGSVVGVMGSLQATEVVKELLGIGTSLSGYMLLFEGLDLAFRKVRVQKDAHCFCTEKSAAINKNIHSSHLP